MTIFKFVGSIARTPQRNNEKTPSDTDLSQ